MVSETLTPGSGDCRRKSAMYPSQRPSMTLSLICAGLAALSLSQSADAADMPGIYQQYRPAGAVTEYVSGWYLRGDVGYRTNTSIGSMTSLFALPTDVDLADVATIGAGGGYKAGWFRADVTVDYAGKAQFSGNGPFVGAFAGKVESWTVLGNVYLDLGTWNGLTPYIGAGAGAVGFRSSDFNAPLGFLTTDMQSQTEFAWAYMAGLAWCFAPRWLVDLSYRRMNIGDVTFNPSLNSALTLKDLTANEFRIGLRYNFD
jgi:opacity protein-like surface antigen